MKSASELENAHEADLHPCWPEAEIALPSGQARQLVCPLRVLIGKNQTWQRDSRIRLIRAGSAVAALRRAGHFAAGANRTVAKQDNQQIHRRKLSRTMVYKQRPSQDRRRSQQRSSCCQLATDSVMTRKGNVQTS